MEFEHVVQVNDLKDSSIADLTRKQLWDGLVLRATAPHHFVIGLGEYELDWQTDTLLKRSLELPEPRSLFVRFSYCARYLKEIGDDFPYDLFVQQAYIAADIDTIRIIRNRLTSH